MLSPSGVRALSALLALSGSVAAAVPESARTVQTILAGRCVACHYAGGGQAGLSLASLGDALRGGSSGPAIVPGNPTASLLLQRISGPRPAMPPVGEPLSDKQVDAVARWIKAGAPGVDSAGEDPADAWWSFAPLNRPSVPADGGGWSRNEIDRFVAAKHSEMGLRPAPEADRTTLIRRLSYNLLGLPPSPEQVRSFVEDSSSGAYERLVDGMLASPRYGERWGRHWLDVVHYGESHGYDKDKARRNAWPYRDYVIRSFNGDKPYARFIREQIAGDVLWPADPEGLIATGFVAAGPWDYVGHAELREGTKDKQLARLLDRDDMVAATMSTFTSLTVHCARCHDHKFDPILQADYYALQAVFAGVDRADQPYFDDPEVHAKGRDVWRKMRKAHEALARIEAQMAEATSDEISRLDKRSEKISQQVADSLPKVGEVDTEESIALRTALGKESVQVKTRRNELALARLPVPTQEEHEALTLEIESLESQLGALPGRRTVYSAATYFEPYGTFTPAWSPRPVHLLAKGSVEAPLERALPGAVSAVAGLAARFGTDSRSDEGSGRAALAAWISDSRNPLTWRSIANRVWHYHFGRGLADSPNDFGRMGSAPTHPELLDWLAVEVRDGGGSLKRLHRKILLSATYRQASSERSGQRATDAGNRWLWRMNRNRLDAEAVRDTLLAISGQMDLSMGGPSAEQFVFKDDHSPVYDYAHFDVASPAARRRSVYRFLVRSVQDPFMESLDCADPSLLVPRRSSTLTAVQALALLNDPLVIESSRHFADRMREGAPDLASQVERGIRLALGRDASDEETSLLASHGRQHGLENVARLIINSNEFLFVD